MGAPISGIIICERRTAHHILGFMNPEILDKTGNAILHNVVHKITNVFV
jgi:hypothetical protein